MEKGTSNKKNRADQNFFDGTSALIFGSVILVSVLTYIAFILFNKNGLPSDLFVSEYALKKSDWLGFWGCVLGVLSTIVFSSLSWKQNKTLNRINDGREKKDTFFAKLRFAAEFYSLVEFESLSITVNQDKTSKITMEFSDIGKTPSTFINIEKFIIRPSVELEKLRKVKTESVESCLVHQTRVYVKGQEIRRSSECSIKRSTISFDFEEKQTVKFQELYRVVEEVAMNYDYHVFSKSFISLEMNYIIENSLKVRTLVKTVMFLQKPIDFHRDNGLNGEFSLNVVDIAVESMEYIFIGEIQ